MNWVLIVVIGAAIAFFLTRRRRPPLFASAEDETVSFGDGERDAGVRPSFMRTWNAGGRSWANPVAAMSRDCGMFPTTPGGLETLLELEGWINAKDDRAPSQITTCLEGADPGVCHYVAMWCANLGMKECEPALIAILQRPEDVWGYARKQSALALGRLGCVNAVDALRKARMREASEGVAESMTEAIRKLEMMGAPVGASR